MKHARSADPSSSPTSSRAFDDCRDLAIDEGTLARKDLKLAIQIIGGFHFGPISFRDLLENIDCLAPVRIIIEPIDALGDGSSEAYELFLALLRGATSARLTDDGFAQLAARAGEGAARDYETLMRRGLTQSHRDWLAANNRREDVRRRWRAFFGGYDALLSPVATTPAFPRMAGVPKPEQRFMINGAPRPAADTYYWLSIASLPYLPATTIPLGLNASGLPIGAEVVGPEFSDISCIQIAHLIEQAFGGCAQPPGFA